MKKYLITLIPVVLLGWQRGPEREGGISLTAETSLSEDIKPISAQYKAEELTTRILGNYHYRKIPLNDSLSSAMFDRFIDGIDHNKLYYEASDLAILKNTVMLLTIIFKKENWMCLSRCTTFSESVIRNGATIFIPF